MHVYMTIYEPCELNCCALLKTTPLILFTSKYLSRPLRWRFRRPRRARGETRLERRDLNRVRRALADGPGIGRL